MWFSLFALILLLAIAYFHSIRGLFSALLSAVLAILCAALAFATFEYIAVKLLVQLKPDYALGLSLMGMFILPLFILRVGLDRYVHRACLLPLLVDKAGGFVFGVVAAYLMVGMLAISLQLMPFGNGFLGFTRVDRADPTKAEQNELWLQPDRFAARLASGLSSGVLSGKAAFASIHPDFVTEVGWIDSVIPTSKVDRRGVRRFAPPGAIRVMRAWEETSVYRKSVAERDKPGQTESRKAGADSRFIRIQMQVQREAQDADNQHRFTLFQVRLVGDRGSRGPEQYHAIAVADSEEPAKAIYEVKGKGEGEAPLIGQLLKPNAGNQVDVVFEVAKDFVPRFVEYKSGAREALKLTEAPADSTFLAGTGAASDGGVAPPGQTEGAQGRVSGFSPTGTFFGDSFPNGITMTAYQPYQGIENEIDNARQALKSGHLQGPVGEQGTRPPVSRFEVPPDKRLLHLNVVKLQPGSILGKALNLAVTTVKNYLVIDSMGREYRPVGAYVIANLGVTPFVEVQYSPEYADLTGRGLHDWARLRENMFRGEYTYVLLYLVEPGAQLVSFSTGGGGVAPVDLGGMNLTAPP
ncbi:MAG: CvpA family protein [Planctomycetota bacterium]